MSRHASIIPDQPGHIGPRRRDVRLPPNGWCEAPGEALVQVVTVTTDRDAAISELARRLEAPSAGDFHSTPFLLIGTHEQMATQLRTQATELGITSYVVREPAVPDLERVLSLLATS